jgi:hypothetical protein
MPIFAEAIISKAKYIITNDLPILIFIKAHSFQDNYLLPRPIKLFKKRTVSDEAQISNIVIIHKKVLGGYSRRNGYLAFLLFDMSDEEFRVMKLPDVITIREF